MTPFSKYFKTYFPNKNSRTKKTEFKKDHASTNLKYFVDIVLQYLDNFRKLLNTAKPNQYLNKFKRIINAAKPETYAG